jgi:murein DD-endopeptidase MepM/ murein hydrolase activator NlpD
VLVLVGSLLPAESHAGVWSSVVGFLSGTASAQSAASSAKDNLQTFALPQPAMNIDPSPDRGGGDVTIVDDSALVPEEGPSGTIADIEKPENGTISTYIVQPGDTLSSIATLFDVSQGTILAANDLKRGAALHVGDKLVILPVTGIPYTVKSGDTLASIAKRFGGDATEIANYNSVDDSTLATGDQIIIPNGEVPATATVVKTTTKTPTKSGTTKAGGGRSSSSGVFANNPAEPAHNVGAPGTSAQIAYYIAPLSHYIKTQGIHGYNAVDLAAPIGTPIMAAADGDVVVARAGGWNGGYGSYVVISHSNGSQTLYGHMSKVAAYDGEHVVQGQVIGYVGETGEATGPHVHFEIRDGIQNPF